MTRKERDAYYSPDLCASVLTRLLPIEPLDLILEPSVGGGSFARAIKGLNVPTRLIGCDIWPQSAGFVHCDQRIDADFLTLPLLHPAPLWVIGNPPFVEAEAHTRKALGLTDRYVAFLLRAAFLEGESRAAFWDVYPARHVYFLRQRPSFTEDGKTDSCMYAFFWWDKLHTGPSTYSVVSWKQYRKA